MDTNASMAIRIAAGMLIAVMIIALLIYFFKSLSPWQQSIDDRQTEEQITAFNKEFLAYNKKIMYGTDLISVINKAANNNKYYIETFGLDEAKDYIVDINFSFKTKLTERIEIYKMITGNKEVKLKYNPTPSEKPMFQLTSEGLNDLKSVINSDSRIDNSIALWLQTSKFNNETIEIAKTSSSVFKVPGEKDDSGKDTYLTKDAYSIVKSANNMKLIITNPDTAKYNLWSKFIYESVDYDIKSRKFKCSSVKYNDTTGRISKMVFEEIAF